MSASLAAPQEARKLEQARLAWVTADRDTELERWQEWYALAVPRTAAPVAEPAVTP